MNRTRFYQCAALAALLLLPSCISTNLAAWADTRVASPAQQSMREGVAVLFIIPALAADLVLLPIQLLARCHPYGDVCEPDPPEVRHGND